MKMNSIKTNFKKNLFYGVSAQSVTFGVSCIVTFILPKYIGVTEYSFWQLFIFYTGYVCFFHFGIPDGIYLSYGGKSIERIPIDSTAKQFRFMIFYQMVISIIIVVGSICVTTDKNRALVGCLVAYYVIVVNFNNFYGMIYQATNNARWYSISLIIDKIVFLALTILLLINQIKDFYPYIIAYCIGRTISCVYSCMRYPDLLIHSSSNITWKKDVVYNIRSGIKLMLSVISSTLVIGIARFIVDKRWGIETFGFLSFSLTISNFILQFINQVAIVLFPNIRLIAREKIADSYIHIRSIVCVVLEISVFMYIPMKFIVNSWLSQYSVSIGYMAYFIPICIFDGKMQLMAVTFMKTLRKEGAMLAINLISLTYCAIICLIGAYCFNNLNIIIFGMISAIVLRSTISELYIANKLRVDLKTDIIIEWCMVAIYWIMIYLDKTVVAFATYIIIYLVRLIFHIYKIRGYKLSL